MWRDKLPFSRRCYTAQFFVQLLPQPIAESRLKSLQKLELSPTFRNMSRFVDPRTSVSSKVVSILPRSFDYEN